MLDINAELEKIIEKYKLDRHYPAYRVHKTACDYMRRFVKELADSGESSLLICTKTHTYQLLKTWIGGDDNNVSAIRILSSESLNDYLLKLHNTEHIYVAAKSETNEILHWLWRHGFCAESVYDILEEQAVYVPYEFCYFFEPIQMSRELELDVRNENIKDGSALILYEYYYQRQRFEHSDIKAERDRLAEKIFFLALCMKNFIEAEKWLEKVTERKLYEQCWEEIQALLQIIEHELHENKQSHIVVYWLDDLGYDHAQQMEYLKQIQDHSVVFQNAFTTTPYTHPTLKAMFCNVLQVDDLGYKINYIGMDNSPLLRDILDMGYNLSMISRSHNSYFGDRYATNSNSILYLDSPCSEIYWDLIDQIIRAENPTVYFAHAVMEIHQPALSVKRKNFEKKYSLTKETLAIQIQELNEQLQFYDSMLGGGETYRIYMSDHGDKADAWSDLHVLFQIYHASWEGRFVSKLFCYLDFAKIICALMRDGDIRDTLWNRDYVQVQDVDHYNRFVLRAVLEKRGLDRLPFYIAYKGIVTQEYVYLHFKTDDELYYHWEDGPYYPVIGMDNEYRDTELFTRLREQAGEFPQALDTDQKFSYAKNTYIVYDNLKKTVYRAASVLYEKLKTYADKSVVLLGGGYHSMQLLAVLPEEGREKIGGVIDSDVQCLCGKKGYPVILYTDELPAHIKVILLSQDKYAEENWREAVRRYDNRIILDPYQYWKDNGLIFEKEFWYGLRSDIDLSHLEKIAETQTDIPLSLELGQIAGTLAEDIEIRQDRSSLFRDLKRESRNDRASIVSEIRMGVVYEKIKDTIRRVSKLLNEMLEQYEDNSIALRPGGYHTWQICAILNENSRKKIGVIIDKFKACRCAMLGYKICEPSDKLPESIKVVFISTYLNRDELKTEVKEAYENLAIIDIYQYWADQGYLFWKDFWYGTKDDWKE